MRTACTFTWELGRAVDKLSQACARFLTHDIDPSSSPSYVLLPHHPLCYCSNSTARKHRASCPRLCVEVLIRPFAYHRGFSTTSLHVPVPAVSRSQSRKRTHRTDWPSRRAAALFALPKSTYKHCAHLYLFALAVANKGARPRHLRLDNTAPPHHVGHLQAHRARTRLGDQLVTCRRRRRRRRQLYHGTALQGA
jgi:hypothetical protein